MVIGSKTDLVEEPNLRAVKTEDGEKLAEVNMGGRESKFGRKQIEAREYHSYLHLPQSKVIKSDL